MESARRLSFGANADAYARARPEWPEEAARWLVPEGARLVVELGAGTGKLTRALSALGVEVVAVEPDPRMLAVLRGLGLDGVEGAAEAIPVPDGAADAVVAGSAIHWFDLPRALLEAHRVLRPGGRLAFGWNHRDGSAPGMDRFAAAIAEARGGRSGWAERPWPELVSAGGLFAAVEHARFPHVHELPRAALPDHLRSYATIAALPEAEQDALLTRLERLVDADPALRLGDTLTLPFAVDAYRAVRIP
ncbi:MAG TPA: class I SAM-dependent methyltransferase [Gaiellaceae bacterium]|nr:class I SAM-dependent methyltransferase [Gaiellaceae bacterium]